jgi:hypothetical protein
MNDSLEKFGERVSLTGFYLSKIEFYSLDVGKLQANLVFVDDLFAPRCRPILRLGEIHHSLLDSFYSLLNQRVIKSVLSETKMEFFFDGDDKRCLSIESPSFHGITGVFEI